MAASLICSDTVSRVSSVLNRDAKQFGKKYMFDCNEETCWNSDQGLSQWVLLQFPRASRVSAVILQFQGGFSAKTCRLEGCLREGTFVKITDFYPEDNNSSQSFPIEESPLVDKLKIAFENSTDFFGRIVVYSLDVLGERAS
ncbi:nuclear receptor 2C2-associated protein [Scleropages formosus]|uniref:Nuclear receptor 2C2-associated protein n=1 Tax=Scleropages formosus TaxID=113540 RepID=A0A8C9R888_SCLFO|nr:nuclear receptor 2C2-associated protein [Scleropages formosus]